MKNFDYAAINKELRFRAKLIDFFLGSYTRKKFVVRDKLTTFLFKGHKWCTGIEYNQKYICRKDGSKLRICIYKPKNMQKKAKASVLWMHGGGYAMGEPEQSISFIKDIVKLGCVVVAPAYTKSIAKPFPAAIDDCYLTLEWMHNNADNLNYNKEKIFVGGESAGGGLTAALSLMARDKGKIKISFQMPIYPMLDCSDTNSSKNNNAPVWNTDSNHLAWNEYLGENYNEDVSKYASPAKETDYSNLPSTITYVGDLEPFKDETINYVNNLKRAGIDVKFKIFKGCYHGFDIVGKNTKPGKDAKTFLLNGIIDALNK